MAEGGALAVNAELDSLRVGQTASYTKTIEMADVEAFAALSGDNNPLHLDPAAAAAGPFKRPVAHGMLTAALISTVLGTKLPGPGCIYLGQTLKFRAPVFPGDEVEAEAEIAAVDTEKRRITVATTCRVADKVVAEGEALILVPG